MASNTYSVSAMTNTVKEMQVLQQGGETFLPVSTWNDVLQSSSTHAEYDLAAARTAMGFPAGFPLFVIFSADGPFWANFKGNAAIPGGNTTDGSSSEFSPNARYVDGTVSKISLVSANSVNVSMQFFRP